MSEDFGHVKISVSVEADTWIDVRRYFPELTASAVVQKALAYLSEYHGCDPHDSRNEVGTCGECDYHGRRNCDVHGG